MESQTIRALPELTASLLGVYTIEYAKTVFKPRTTQVKSAHILENASDIPLILKLGTEISQNQFLNPKLMKNKNRNYPD